MIILTTIQNIFCVVSGSLVGFSLGLIGGGGSILAVPLLLFFVGLDSPHVVIGTTALAVGINAFINLFIHHRSGNVVWHVAIPFTIVGVIGAIAGSIFGKLVNGHLLIFAFALFMLFIAYRMYNNSINTDLDNHEHDKGNVVLYGSGVGLLAGFFGIGGGFLIVPALIRSARLSIVKAIGTSLVAVFALGITTASSYALSGLVDWTVAGEFILGGSIGGIIGVKTANRLGTKGRSLHIIFAIFVTIVAFYMIWKEAAAGL